MATAYMLLAFELAACAVQEYLAKTMLMLIRPADVQSSPLADEHCSTQTRCSGMLEPKRDFSHMHHP